MRVTAIIGLLLALCIAEARVFGQANAQPQPASAAPDAAPASPQATTPAAPAGPATGAAIRVYVTRVVLDVVVG